VNYFVLSVAENLMKQTANHYLQLCDEIRSKISATKRAIPIARLLIISDGFERKQQE